MKKSTAVALLTLSSSAFADVPPAVTTALTTAQADGVVVAGLVLVAIVAIYAFKLMRKGL